MSVPPPPAPPRLKKTSIKKPLNEISLIQLAQLILIIAVLLLSTSMWFLPDKKEITMTENKSLGLKHAVKDLEGGSWIPIQADIISYTLKPYHETDPYKGKSTIVVMAEDFKSADGINYIKVGSKVEINTGE